MINEKTALLFQVPQAEVNETPSPWKEGTGGGNIATGDEEDRPPTVQEFRSRTRRLLSSGSSSFAQSMRFVVDSTFSFSGKAVSVREFSGRATVASEIATISKNLIGGGVLS